MRWITTTDLDVWAQSLPARTEFPGLIEDLILATLNPRSIGSIRFPRGDSGSLPGFDGHLETTDAIHPVPEGRSIWECKAGSNFKTDATAKFDQYGTALAKSERLETTLVLATPRAWRSPKEELQGWIRDLNDRGEWKKVEVIEGTGLERWLTDCPAVAVHWAMRLLKLYPDRGLWSLSDWWDDYSKRFAPPLTEAVALAGRTAQAERVVDHLMTLAAGSAPLKLLGDSPREVLAFVTAAVSSAPEDVQRILRARTLVLDRADLNAQIRTDRTLGFVLSAEAAEAAGPLSARGPVVVAMGADHLVRDYERLERASRTDFAAALETMTSGSEAALREAYASGRSVTILHRRLGVPGSRPAWSSEGEALLPAVLAGRWDARSEEDRAAVERIASRPYDEYEERLAPFRDVMDSPIELAGGLWAIRAPVDAMTMLARFFTKKHLSLLGEEVVRVFGRSGPPSPSEERFGRSFGGPSSTLRDGLAHTLLMLSALPTELGVQVPGIDLPRWVRDLVESLPGLYEDGAVIEALDQQLPLLMEAAPDPLLSALERLLEGDGEKAQRLFWAEGRLGAPASRSLAPIGWALETAAWDQRLFPRVARLTARLAELDPGGRDGNRPISTLTGLFLPWMPGTTAPLAERLAVLREVLDAAPKAGWQLLLRLMPEARGAASPTHRPRYREAGPKWTRPLRSDVHSAYQAVIDHALQLAGRDPGRWLELLRPMPRFSPEDRARFVEGFNEAAVNASSEDRARMASQLRAQIARHTRYSGAAWALDPEDVERLKNVLDGLNDSDDDVSASLWLFDSWLPRSADLGEDEAAVERARAEAVAKVARGGTAEVVRLAKRARFPWGVAHAALQAIGDRDQRDELLAAAAADPDAESFAVALSGARRHAEGETFQSRFEATYFEHVWPDRMLGELIAPWPDGPETWNFVAIHFPRALKAYWNARPATRFAGEAADLTVLIGHLLEAGRPGAAITASFERWAELDWPQLQRMLRDLADAGGVNGDLADDYEIERLLEHLSGRDDVPRAELARSEFALLPRLRGPDRPLVLHQLMMEDPQLFLSILKLVFRSEDEPEEEVPEPTPEEKARMDAAYGLLIEMRSSPGEVAGVVSADRLDRWLDAVLTDGAQSGFGSVAAVYAGKAIAHSSPAGDTWPQEPVAQAIERIRSDDLESGVQTERFNMRGVYSKGILEGGAQERELAEQCRSWARERAAYPRTAALLHRIADGWDEDAKREDERAARDRIRFG